MKRWIKFTVQFLVGLAVLLGLNWGLQARAQFPGIPGIPDIPADIPVQVPGLEDLLAKEPALTTSLEDAQRDIPFLDDYNPADYNALRLLPLDDTNRFQVPPGDYAFNSQSYCLRAGTHVPGSGDGYLYAPLKGNAADIIQNVLRRSVDHPEIPQSQVQMLLWAIIAHSDLASLPGSRLQVARTLLTEEELNRLSSGALGQIPEELLRRALRELPPVAQQVFEANARIRDTIGRANSTFEDLERIAVLFGEPTVDDNGRDVPAQRWSYNPDGYFIRYQPDGYSRTEMHVSVPAAIELTRDAQGRITALTHSDGDRIEIQYDDNVAPLRVSGDGNVSGYAIGSIRLVRDELMAPETILSFDQTWSGQGWTLVGVPQSGGRPQASGRYAEAARRYQQAQRYQQQQANLFNQVNITDNGAARRDLADIYHLQQAIAPVIDPPANSWTAEQLALLPRAWQYQLCRHAGACRAVARQSSDSLIASAGGLYLAQASSSGSGDTAFDPSGGAAVPGTSGKQRLGESNRPIPEEDLPPEKDPRCGKVRRELEGLKRNQSVYGDPNVRELARRNNLDGYEYNQLVHEVIKQQRSQGDDYSFSPENQREAVEAVISGAEDTGSDDSGGDDLEIGATTNAATCEISISDRADFEAKGIPGIVHDAYLDHEQLHQQHCRDRNDPNANPDGYKDYMRDVDNYSREEVEAYQESINTLERWLRENC